MTRPSGGLSSGEPPEKPDHPPGKADGGKPSVPPGKADGGKRPVPPGKADGGKRPENPGHVPGDEVLLTARQQRRAAREERRQAKDAAYDLRQARKKAKDGTSWRGHNIVDERGLADAFPEPETPELNPVTVRRRITHGVVLVLLLALLVAGVVLAAMVQRGELHLTLGAGKPTPTPVTCPAETLEMPGSKSVTVNVFNAGSTEGQAGKVAEELKKRGFVVKNVANKATEYGAPTVVVSGPGGHGAALNMQRNFPNSEYVQDDREDSTVDVIVTSQFNGLVDAAKVEKKPGVLSCPRLSPPPSAVPDSASQVAKPGS